MPARRIILSILGILIIIGGVVAGVILIRQRQQLQKEAAVPGGQATVTVSPESGTFNVGETFTVSVFFNTAGISISSVNVRLRYPFTGVSAEITASNVQINSALTSSGDWNCPTKNVTSEGGNVNIDIGCANIGASGYSTNTNTLLATFDLTATRTPVNNPTVSTFDPTNSIITQKSNGQDILRIPSGPGSTGTYTIGGQAEPTQTPSATPTGPRISPSVTPTGTIRPTSTSTPTLRLTATPTSTTSAALTPTSTGKGGLPEAGVSAPTLFGIGAGALLIISALMLAL
jgi:hypothetical protein